MHMYRITSFIPDGPLLAKIVRSVGFIIHQFLRDRLDQGSRGIFVKAIVHIARQSTISKDSRQFIYTAIYGDCGIAISNTVIVV